MKKGLFSVMLLCACLVCCKNNSPEKQAATGASEAPDSVAPVVDSGVAVADPAVNASDESRVEVERHLIDVNGDGAMDTLILENSMYGDPHTYEDIKIKMASGDSNVVIHVFGYYNLILPNEELAATGDSIKIVNESHLVVYKGYGLSGYDMAKVNKVNLIRSDKIFVLKQTPDGIVMLVWNYSYPSCQERFLIIQFIRGKFISYEIEDRTISAVSLSDSGDMITVLGYRFCEKKEKDETFYIPIAK